MPQNEAGCLIDPPVSVPVEAGANPAATAAAEPQMSRLNSREVPWVETGAKMTAFI